MNRNTYQFRYENECKNRVTIPLDFRKHTQNNNKNKVEREVPHQAPTEKHVNNVFINCFSTRSRYICNHLFLLSQIEVDSFLSSFCSRN